MANNACGITASGSMRPRANTISHVDKATLGMLAVANSSVCRQESHGLGLGLNNNSLINPMSNGLPGVSNYHYRGMAAAAGHHGDPHGLPKLDTNHLNSDFDISLHTAPPFGSFGGEMDMESIWFGPGSSTVNPAQIHISNSPQNLAFDTPQSPWQQGFAQTQPMIDNEGNLSWLNSFEHQMSFDDYNEQAIDGSSPSAISTGSPGGMSEVLLDGSSHPINTSEAWQNTTLSQASFAPAYSMDFSGAQFPDLYGPSQLSPRSLNAHMGNTEQYFPSPPLMDSRTPLSMLPGMGNCFHPPMTTNSDTPSNSAASVSSSNRQSSVTSISTESITDTTRQALLASLSQQSTFDQRKSSFPQLSSPSSRSGSTVPLPSTCDLQRYVAAYIQYFHPHLPFLHMPSLSFDSPAFTSSLPASSGHFALGQSGIAGGGGALILAMAAIGALYEYEYGPSKDLFEMAKKMIQLYLDERRKVDRSSVPKPHHDLGESPPQNTPLWLVQAMLLNVIYGHNCGDKTAAGIASTHCAALVSLARAADLAKSSPSIPTNLEGFHQFKQEDLSKGGEESGQWAGSGSHGILNAQNEWHHWKVGEERKRTLYGIFILSSLLVSAYNHAPALTNSEIQLDLPCDEGLWAADSAETWRSLGGSSIAEQSATSFAFALTSLLTASRRPQQAQYGVSQPLGPSNMKFEDLPSSEIQPSTFGCLVLINALHNYIWETCQRHLGRQWTTEEIEATHGRIEPALRAWQAAWSSNPEHSVERPNPFGASSLSADCIPYLDLAYVRLFVNLGRSKEAFFKREFDTMADELAGDADIVPHADHSPGSSMSNDSNALSSSVSSSPIIDNRHIKLEDPLSAETIGSEHALSQRPGQCTKRERHLRKAAMFAVNSLTMADGLGVTFADFSSRELPLQSALCTFDCAQVLAEWVSTMQQRVGRFLGLIGRDEVDCSQVPGIMLLEDDDCQLLEKIREVLSSAEIKLSDSDAMAAADGPNMEHCGYGSKILLIHARMFEKAAVWPGEYKPCCG